jgi:DNA-binding transcriptional LysR family regulator
MTVMSAPFRAPLPLLDNDILKTFVAIAETGNFSTAAEAVLRTPSAVSMQIKKLEEQLKTVLFLRDARSVTLTQNGEMLLSYARRMLALSNEAVSRFVMPELSGVVRLGAPDDIAERLLPKILRSFGESFPGIMVDVTVDQSLLLRKRMEEQRLDLALINCATHPFPTAGEIIHTEKLVWAGAKFGNAHLREPVPISVWEEGCVWRQDAISQLDKHKRSYRIAYASAHTMAQRAAVVSDLAIAPFPLSYVTDDMQVLGPQEGLPELISFDIRLLTSPSLAAPGKAVAESMRDAFNARVSAAA